MNTSRCLPLAGLAVLAVHLIAAGQEQPGSRSQVNPPRVSQAEPQRNLADEEAAAERLQRRAERRAQRAEQRAAERGAAQSQQAETEQDDSTQSTPAVSPETSATARVQARTFIRASDLIGLRVQGEGDAQLGTVQDVFIDPLTFGVQYVVLDTGAGVDATGQLPILPWALFQTTAGSSLNQGFLVVPLSVEQLGLAPTIAVTNPDLMDSATWVNEVDTFFADELRDVRVARPDFDADAGDEVNDRDSLPIGRRPVTPGTPGAEGDQRANPNGVFDRTNRGRTNRGSRTGDTTPEAGGTRESVENPSGNTNPPGNTPATRNPPGGRTPPGNTDAIDNQPGGGTPPGNTGGIDNPPGGTRPPGNAGPANNTPGGADPPGNTPAPGTGTQSAPNGASGRSPGSR
jgi:hypothetical protein